MSNAPNRIQRYLKDQPHGNGNGNAPAQPVEPPDAPPMPGHPPPQGPPMPGHPPQQAPPQGFPFPPPQGPPPAASFAPPPQPQLQAAPPDPPEGTGGGGGDDDGDGWDFPPWPPYGQVNHENPFVVRHISTVLPEHPMYAIATCPWYAPGEIANLSLLGAPPPTIISYWVFPVQYIETQVRQYFRPEGPFKPLPPNVGDPTDHDEAHYRELGWKANPVSVERCAVFLMNPGGRLVEFDYYILDTPVSDWQMVTIDRQYDDGGATIMDRLEHVRDHKWLNPDWLESIPAFYAPFNQLPSLYQQARDLPVPLACATPGWEMDL